MQAQFFNATLFGTDFRDLYPVARQEVFSESHELRAGDVVWTRPSKTSESFS